MLRLLLFLTVAGIYLFNQITLLILLFKVTISSSLMLLIETINITNSFSEISLILSAILITAIISDYLLFFQ